MEISIEREREGKIHPPLSNNGNKQRFCYLLKRAHPKASCLKGERRFSVIFFYFFRRAWGKGDGEDLLCLGMLRNPYIFLSVPIRVDAHPGRLKLPFVYTLWAEETRWHWLLQGCLDSLNASIISNGFGWVVKTSMCLIWLGGGGRETARRNWLIVIWSLHWESKSAKCHWRRSSIYNICICIKYVHVKCAADLFGRS